MGLLRLVAPRLLTKSTSGGTRSLAMAGVCLSAIVGSVGAIALGVRHPGLLLAMAVGLFGLGITLAARHFQPLLAVSIIGVGLGVASLVTVLAVGAGFEDEVTRGLARLNGHAMVTKYGLDFHEYEQMVAGLEADPAVQAASPFVYGMAAMVGPAAEEGADEGEAGPEVVMIKGLDPKHASDFEGLAELSDSGDLARLRPANPHVLPGAVVGQRLAARMGLRIGDRVVLVAPKEIDGSRRALGGPPRRIEAEVTDFVSVGVADYDEDLVLLHLTAAQALLFGEARVTGIEIQLVEPPRFKTDVGRIDAALNRGRRLRLYRASSWLGSSSILQVVRQLRAVISLVLTLIVVVASASLIGGLMVLVRSKRAFIAVVMALGASRRRVFWLFESVGLLAGLLGGTAGLITGMLLCRGIAEFRFPLETEVYPIDHLPVLLSVTDGLVAVGVAVALCGLASGPAAVAATRTHPARDLART